VHFYGAGKYLFRGIRRVVIANDGDVALCTLDQFTSNSTGQPMLNKVMTLSARRPAVGARASTFAYPTTVIKRDDANMAVHCNTTWHHGQILEHYPKGRDRVLLPNECFRTDINIPGGASGGPVVGEDGKVFGINSTGWDGTPDSFVSSISRLLPLTCPGAVLPDGTTEPTLATLAKYGFASLSD
jgi:hypothetical protein